jgi:ribosomal protein S18 acetylase RimI-like enzyme
MIEPGPSGSRSTSRSVSDLRQPSAFVGTGGELRLSNLGQLELLRGVTERGVPLRTSVRGFSMSPFIRDRDVLTIAPLDSRDPRPGEVIAFTLPGSGRLAVHRVVARRGAGWLVRGDNCPEADGVITRDEMLGRVVRVERGGREVRLGLGAQGAWIAALNRGEALTRLRAFSRLPRRTAASALNRAQSFAVYRAVAGRLAPRVEIVDANEADLAAVQRHLNPLSMLGRREPDPCVTEWVAKRGAKVVGFVQLVYHPESHAPWLGYWLFSLTVWRQYRGQGIGEALTRRVIAHAQREGATELLLVVYEDNVPAIALYRRLGFVGVTLAALEPSLAPEKRESGRRRIVMRKLLKSGMGGAGDGVGEGT